MKAFTVTAILVVLTAIAVAKPVPVKNLNPMEDRIRPSPALTSISTVAPPARC